MRPRSLIVGALAIAAIGVGLVAVLGGEAEEPAEAYTSVREGDDFFQPRIIRVPVGTEVYWTNNGRNPHTVTAVDGSFDSGIMDRGATFEHEYDEPGIYPFWCTLHGTRDGAGMAGIVVVGDVPLSAAGGSGVGRGASRCQPRPGRPSACRQSSPRSRRPSTPPSPETSSSSHRACTARRCSS